MLSLNKMERILKKRKRIGRGSDRGGTSGKGHKGQKARSGSSSELKPWFEGGQMSLTRRLPKRGFTNRFADVVKIVNLKNLETVFSDGEKVNRESLRDKGLIKGKGKFFIKVLGNGQLTKKLIISADKFSKSAVESIEKAGGKVELVKEL